MARIPEHINYSNEWGTELLGPVGDKDKLSENLNTNYVKVLRNNYTEIQTLDGNKQTRVQGSDHELCGLGLVEQDNKEGSSEQIAKSIICENGDLILSAPNGNVKILAKNIYVETVGDGTDGSILMKSNDHITMKADEQLNLGGGKICMTSADCITINAKGYLRLLCADIIEGSPLSGPLSAFLPGPVADLISDIAETCK
tara:strand:+ start:103 stop:702 length:600 start_codon:yes stop_codon:yes gene_type:complete